MRTGNADAKRIVGQGGNDAFPPEARSHLVVDGRCAMVGEGDVEEYRPAIEEFAIRGLAKDLLLHAEPQTIAIMPLQGRRAGQNARLSVYVEQQIVARRVAVPAANLVNADAAGCGRVRI